MDIQMPVMYGLEATYHIRKLQDSKKASIPIVALTANLLKGDGERYMAAGMNGYLSKPFDDQTLFDIISVNLKNGDMPGTGMPKESNVRINPGSPENLYDLSMVAAIAGGDDGFVKKMVQIFLDTMPSSVDQLQRELKSQNWETLSKLAHKMKSTIDSMGIVSLKEVIRSIEGNAKKQVELEGLAAQVNKVSETLGRCIHQLKNEFAL
jgi:CheY-like chemotaxis protein